ncbi:hypothetical protein AVEN_104496-1 [Araneus ventricosus]|uniref:Uncharacterized protein n=1 Tax=Araneus ventricosus TaxID=182803 RepID=A0A4Y2INC7_ARAVE|nr:hypothetical protein AVEN_104496-1 [Araneus ventricosus]
MKRNGFKKILVSFNISQIGTKVYGPFFFCEKTVTGANYLDMLQLCCFRNWLVIPGILSSNRTGTLSMEHSLSSIPENELPHRRIRRVGEAQIACTFAASVIFLILACHDKIDTGTLQQISCKVTKHNNPLAEEVCCEVVMTTLTRR